MESRFKSRIDAKKGAKVYSLYSMQETMPRIFQERSLLRQSMIEQHKKCPCLKVKAQKAHFKRFPTNQVNDDYLFSKKEIR
jgi:hypothetical protein